MKGVDLLRTNDELFEVKRRIRIDRFKNPLTGENAELLKEWFKCEKILIAKQTNEYLFVNKIEDAQIVEDLEN